MLPLGSEIRRLRKEKGLTQQALAEIFDVSVGAVYKWELGLAYPGLEKVVKIAEYFEVSTDVLLQHEVKSNRIEDSLDRIDAARKNLNETAIAEAEMLMNRYPNNFDVIYKGALVFYTFALENKDKDLLYKSLDAYGKASQLLHQNKDPKISLPSLQGKIASIYAILEEYEQALTIYKKNNIQGIFNPEIGQLLAVYLADHEQAKTYFSAAFFDAILVIIQVSCGYSNIFVAQKDYASLHEILSSTLIFLTSLYENEQANFLFHIEALLQGLLAYSALKLGDQEQAEQALRRARAVEIAYRETAPENLASIKFIQEQKAFLYGNWQNFSTEGVEGLIKSFDDEALTKIWEKVKYA